MNIRIWKTSTIPESRFRSLVSFFAARTPHIEQSDTISRPLLRKQSDNLDGIDSSTEFTRVQCSNQQLHDLETRHPPVMLKS